jgi:DNA mismatch repair protein MutL
MNSDKIRLLSNEEINQIAAGEVILGPQYAVKELIENAIDAGARNIRIELKEGGKKLIRVRDDGIGMSRDDLLLSVKRHSTSKFTSLENIIHLGFRGEGLFSLAQVGDLTISSNGYCLRGGKIEPCLKTKFTRVELANIFEKIPARKAFLQSSSGTLRAILALIFPYTIFYDNIKFTVHNNGRWKKIGPSLDSQMKILHFLGKHRTVDGLNSLVNCQGHIILNDEYPSMIFVNGRPITDRALANVIRRTYALLIGRENCSFILRIGCDPRYLDVNVHPTKEQIRFRDIDIKAIVKDAILEGCTSGEQYLNKPTNPHFLRDSVQQRQKVLLKTGVQSKISPSELKVFFTLYNRYVFLVFANRMVVIDQHAAHERLLAHKIMGSKIIMNVLLEPFFVTVGTKPLEHLKPLIKFRRVNSGIMVEAMAEFLTEDKLREILRTPDSFTRKHLLSFAHKYGCNKAIRTGYEISRGEAIDLFEKIQECPQGHQCNHGRPTWLVFDKKYLDKIFGRTGAHCH